MVNRGGRILVIGKLSVCHFFHSHAEKDNSNVLQRAQEYINGLKQINDAIVEDIAHKNRMILDKGKRQINRLKKI